MVKILSLHFQTRDGYIFKGWVDKNETPIYNKVLLAEDTTLYAVWKKDVTNNKITITFDTKGGSKIESITIGKDTELTLPKDPTRDGYIFKGWEQEMVIFLKVGLIKMKLQFITKYYLQKIQLFMQFGKSKKCIL